MEKGLRELLDEITATLGESDGKHEKKEDIIKDLEIGLEVMAANQPRKLVDMANAYYDEKEPDTKHVFPSRLLASVVKGIGGCEALDEFKESGHYEEAKDSSDWLLIDMTDMGAITIAGFANDALADVLPLNQMAENCYYAMPDDLATAFAHIVDVEKAYIEVLQRLLNLSYDCYFSRLVSRDDD